MKLALFLTILFSIARATIIELDSNNFDEIVGHDLPVFVKFYATWCSHCRILVSIWEQVGETFSESDGVIIAQVDADKASDLYTRFKLDGYPTLLYFPKNEIDTPIEFGQTRQINDLVQFINEQTGLHKVPKELYNPVVTLTHQNYTSTIKNNPYIFIKFYAPWCANSQVFAPIWRQIAIIFSEEKDVVIAELNNDVYHNIGQRLGVTDYPALFFFKDEKAIEYEGERDVESLVDYINTNTGTQRSIDGSLKPEYGILEEFEEIVKSFPNLTQEHAEQAKEITNRLQGKSKEFAKIYVSIINKIVTNGATYIDNEKTRVQNFIESKSVLPKQKYTFRIRQNILNQFKLYEFEV
ncbi:hypothetical protein WA158_003399 [Blastocystis sp. Blastoise]